MIDLTCPPPETGPDGMLAFEVDNYRSKQLKPPYSSALSQQQSYPRNRKTKSGKIIEIRYGSSAIFEIETRLSGVLLLGGGFSVIHSYQRIWEFFILYLRHFQYTKYAHIFRNSFSIYSQNSLFKSDEVRNLSKRIINWLYLS